MEDTILDMFFSNRQSELTIFLQTIFGQANGFLELRKIGANKVEQKFIPINNGGFRAADYLVKEEGWDIDVYYGVHPRARNEGNAEAIEHCYVLFADFDVKAQKVPVEKNNEEGANGALSWYYFKDGDWYHIKRPAITSLINQLERLKFMPSIVVDSGRGYHLYWLLPNEVTPNEWKFLQGKLIEFLKDNLSLEGLEIDEKIKDLPRIMRLPETLNTKVQRRAKVMSIAERPLNEFQIKRLKEYEPIQKQETSQKEHVVKIAKEGEYQEFEDLAYLLLAPAWKEGQRNELTFYWAGFCKKLGVPIETCKAVISRLQTNLGDDSKDVKNRFRRIEETYIKNVNVKGYQGLLQLGIDAKELQTIGENKLQAKKNDKNKPKLQKYFEIFQDMFNDVIFKPTNDARDILYLWNGKYFEALAYEQFENIFLRFVQDTLNEIATTYYANQVYDNLSASTKTKTIPEWKPVIAFDNCVFNLNAFTVSPHAPEYGNRFFVNANFNYELFLEAMSFETWEERFWYIINKTTAFKQYVESLEMSDLLLTQIIEMGGYLMLPRIKRYNFETAFILYGNGANGKSTLLSLIQYMFKGFYSTVSLSDLEGFSLASLIGKYLNIANEITEKNDKTIALENLKRTVSWDKMEIPIKFQPHLTTELPIIHVFAVNTKPRTEESTEAAFRRFCFLSFDKTIPIDKRDPEILDKLLDEIDTIATLFVLGTIKVIETKKITNNEDLKISTIMDNNPLVEWLFEKFEPVPYNTLTHDNIGFFTHKLHELRKDFNVWYGKIKFANIDTFHVALTNAIEFLTNNVSSTWENVKILKDTKSNPLFKDNRMLNVVFPLKRKAE